MDAFIYMNLNGKGFYKGQFENELEYDETVSGGSYKHPFISLQSMPIYPEDTIIEIMRKCRFAEKNPNYMGDNE